MSKNQFSASASRGPRILDKQDARAFSKAAEVQTSKITKSAGTAREYLAKGGFITPKTGKLTEKYSDRDKK